MQKRFARAAGGGRKREFSKEISQLGEWLKKERSCSRNVSKNELLKEFFALLVARAERCMVRAELCRNEMQRKAWLKEADCALSSSSFSCREADPMARRSLLSKDRTTHLAPVEEQVRAQLTFQDIDRKLWHLGAAPVAQLEDAHLVADAEMTVEHRSYLVIGMSDQVPLWAKAPSKKLVFSADEVNGASWDDRKRWTEIREELKAAQVQAAAEGYQLVSWADVGAGPLKVAGNKVMKGQSSDEKFRTTYEARQKIYNIGAPAGTALQGDYCGARPA